MDKANVFTRIKRAMNYVKVIVYDEKNTSHKYSCAQRKFLAGEWEAREYGY